MNRSLKGGRPAPLPAAGEGVLETRPVHNPTCAGGMLAQDDYAKGCATYLNP